MKMNKQYYLMITYTIKWLSHDSDIRDEHVTFLLQLL